MKIKRSKIWLNMFLISIVYILNVGCPPQNEEIHFEQSFCSYPNYLERTSYSLKNPVIHDGIIYVGSEYGIFYALDSKDGKEIWKFKTDSTIFSSAAINNGLIYFGNQSGNIYALDMLTGEEKWKFETEDSSSIFFISITNEILIISAYAERHEKNSLYAIDLKTRKKIWHFRRGEKIPYEMVSAHSVYNDKVFVRTTDDYLYALDIFSGAVKWQFRGGFTIAYPIVNQELVYFMGQDYENNGKGYVFMLSEETGEEIGKIKAGDGGEHISLSGKNIFISDYLRRAKIKNTYYSYYGGILAINSHTGRRKWLFRIDCVAVGSHRPVIYKDKVYFRFLGLNAIDLNSWEQKWKFLTKQSTMLINSPLFLNDTMYNMFFDAETKIFGLYAIDNNSGDLIWEVNLNTGE